MSVAPPNALRPARRPKPRRAPNPYFRVAGLAAGGVLAGYLVFAFAVKLIHPYQTGFAVDREIRKERAELKRQEAQNALLARRLAYLQTPDGAETEARRAGYARADEIVYLLRRSPAAVPK